MIQYHFLKKHHHYFLALLLFLSIFILFFNVSKHGTRNFFLTGDEAILELGVVNATKNIQFLGPYSRFGWNHPGPLYFYILLPFYTLFSMGTQSLYAGAIFINLVSLLTILYFIYKNENKHFFYFMALFLSLYVYYFLRLSIFSSIWNPHVTILPFAAFIFTAVHLSLGKINALPISILLATFVVQTHVGFVPIVAGMVFVSLLLYVRERLSILKKPGLLFSKDVLKTVGISMVLFIILWILPLLEEMKTPLGNLFRMKRFFDSITAGHGFFEAVTAVSRMTNAPLVKLLHPLFPGVDFSLKESLVMLLLIQLSLVISLAIYHLKARQKYRANLLIFGLVGLIVSVVSVMRIPGTIHLYLIKWMSIIGLINWCVIFFTLVSAAVKNLGFSPRIFAEHKKIFSYAAVIFISAALFIQQQKAVYFASEIKRNEAKFKFIGDISESIKNYVKKKKIPSFLLKPGSAVWPNGVGIITQLYKSSVPFSMEDHLLFVYGYQFKHETKEKDLILVTKEKEPRASSHKGSLIYRTRKWSVYHLEKE